MSFNLRYDDKLGDLEINGDTLHTEESLNCDSGRYTPNGNAQANAISPCVRMYFGGSYTVNELVELANNALSGKYVPTATMDPTYTEIGDGLSSIIGAFDECRLLVGMTETDTSGGSSTTVGIADLEKPVKEASLVDVKAHPNPFSNNVNVTVTSNDQGVVELEVLDALGRVVYTGNYDCNVGSTSFSINTNDYAVGMYIFNVKMNDEMVRVKVIKQD
jgi:hypothetical protein